MEKFFYKFLKEICFPCRSQTVIAVIEEIPDLKNPVDNEIGDIIEKIREIERSFPELLKNIIQSFYLRDFFPRKLKRIHKKIKTIEHSFENLLLMLERNAIGEIYGEYDAGNKKIIEHSTELVFFSKKAFAIWEEVLPEILELIKECRECKELGKYHFEVSYITHSDGSETPFISGGDSAHNSQIDSKVNQIKKKADELYPLLNHLIKTIKKAKHKSRSLPKEK